MRREVMHNGSIVETPSIKPKEFKSHMQNANHVDILRSDEAAIKKTNSRSLRNVLKQPGTVVVLVVVEDYVECLCGCTLFIYFIV